MLEYIVSLLPSKCQLGAVVIRDMLLNDDLNMAFAFITAERITRCKRGQRFTDDAGRCCLYAGGIATRAWPGRPATGRKQSDGMKPAQGEKASGPRPELALLPQDWSYR